ncbi:hypothetical protein OKW51_000067 [Pseudomonas hunanensis]|nr:hypothetical protein [Pseudomonas hunanensis]
MGSEHRCRQLHFEATAASAHMNRFMLLRGFGR